MGLERGLCGEGGGGASCSSYCPPLQPGQTVTNTPSPPYFTLQLDEGMPALQPSAPHPGELARKYCGGGGGGYALLIFSEREQRDAFVSSEPALSAGMLKDGAASAGGGDLEQRSLKLKSLRIAIEPYVRPVH